MKVNPGTEVQFENKEFRHCVDEDGDVRFDTWVLKSPGNVLKFIKEGFEAKIITSKFPCGFYGYGFGGNALNDVQQCYCSGTLDTKTFKTEFEAQCAAINYVLKYQLPSDWHRHFIRLQMTEFVNPKTLF